MSFFTVCNSSNKTPATANKRYLTGNTKGTKKVLTKEQNKSSFENQHEKFRTLISQDNITKKELKDYVKDYVALVNMKEDY